MMSGQLEGVDIFVTSNESMLNDRDELEKEFKIKTMHGSFYSGVINYKH